MTTEAIITKDPTAAIPVFWDGYSVCCFPRNVAVIPVIIQVMITTASRTIGDVPSHGLEAVFRRHSIFAK
jgi:Cys-tRNA synthase (O-phospho-L-seryl-tRNA:Cys-tRNA synthase)